jgi:hypothetical protein
MPTHKELKVESESVEPANGTGLRAFWAFCVFGSGTLTVLLGVLGLGSIAGALLLVFILSCICYRYEGGR